MNRNMFLSRERLTNSTWSFSQRGFMQLCDHFRFGDDGKIEGYDNFNERSWSVEAGRLRIYRENGQVMWESDIVSMENGSLEITLKSPVFTTWSNFMVQEILPLATDASKPDEDVVIAETIEPPVETVPPSHQAASVPPLRSHPLPEPTPPKTKRFGLTGFGRRK